MRNFLRIFKSIPRFNRLLGLITCILILILSSCQEDTFDQDSILGEDALSMTKKEKNKSKIKYDKIKDIDGNKYLTVQIGEQFWMAENLKTTTYNDGSPIPLVTDDEAWYMLETGAYCWYDHNEVEYKDIYGALYNYFAVNTDKLCPDGWHVPSDEEWTVLTDHLGGADIASIKLKEEGDLYWPITNNGTNESGFSALPGGFRLDHSGFFYIGEGGYWWSSTPTSPGGVCRWCYAWERSIYLNSPVRVVGKNENEGLSIRCLKD